MKKSYFKSVIVPTIALLLILFISQSLFFVPNARAQSEESSAPPGNPQSHEPASTSSSSDDSTGGLVPCNNKCTLCHILVGLQNIFKYLMGLLFVATMFFVTLNGALMMVSAGSKKIVGQVKTALGLCLKGFLLFLICWVIITGIMRTLGYKQLDNWWQFDCDTTQTEGPAPTTTTPTGIESVSKSGSYQPSGNLSPKAQEVLANYMKLVNSGLKYYGKLPDDLIKETANCGSTCRWAWRTAGLPDFWDVKRSRWDGDQNSLKPGDLCITVNNETGKATHMFLVMENGETSKAIPGTKSNPGPIGVSKDGLNYNLYTRTKEKNEHIEVVHIADYIK